MQTSDLQGSGHIVDAGIDDFEVYEGQPASTNPIEAATAIINAYPNPFDETITIAYELTNNDATLQLFNLVGQLLESQSINNKKGSIQIGSNLENGVYLVDKQPVTDLTKILGIWREIIQFFIANYGSSQN